MNYTETDRFFIINDGFLFCHKKLGYTCKMLSKVYPDIINEFDEIVEPEPIIEEAIEDDTQLDT